MKTVFKIWKKCVPYVGKMKKKCVLRFARKCGKAYNKFPKGYCWLENLR